MRRIFLIILITLTTSLNIDESTTEPYVEMDFLEKDKYNFTLNFDSDISTLTVALVNGTQSCSPDCILSGKSANCTLEGKDCQADKDNRNYKFYYAVRYNPNSTSILADKTNGELAYVTVAINSSSFIRSFLFFLSFLIL